MDQERRQRIEREFRYALQVLAAGAPDQIRALSPGCIAYELLDDYDIELRQYREAFGASLTEWQSEAIGRIDEAIDAIPDPDHECFNNDVLTRPAWDEVRDAAKQALAAFGWSDGLPPEYTETAPGVWWWPP